MNSGPPAHETGVLPLNYAAKFKNNSWFKSFSKMAVEDLIISIPESLVGSVKILIYIIQVVGILIIAYIVYFTIQTFLSRKKLKAIEKISKDVSEIKRILKRKKI